MVNITALARSGVGASVAIRKSTLPASSAGMREGGVSGTISTGTARYLPTSAVTSAS